MNSINARILAQTTVPFDASKVYRSFLHWVGVTAILTLFTSLALAIPISIKPIEVTLNPSDMEEFWATKCDGKADVTLGLKVTIPLTETSWFGDYVNFTFSYWLDGTSKVYKEIVLVPSGGKTVTYPNASMSGITESLRAGIYTAGWVLLWDDGGVAGNFHNFTVKDPCEATPDDSGTLSLIAFSTLGLILLKRWLARSHESKG